MKKHLKYINGTSDKFWEIDCSELEYSTTYGKNGTSGTTQVKIRFRFRTKTGKKI